MKLHSYGGKVSLNFRRVKQKRTAVMEKDAGYFERSIFDTPTHRVSKGSENGGGGEVKLEERWMLWVDAFL